MIPNTIDFSIKEPIPLTQKSYTTIDSISFTPYKRSALIIIKLSLNRAVAGGVDTDIRAVLKDAATGSNIINSMFYPFLYPPDLPTVGGRSYFLISQVATLPVGKPLNIAIYASLADIQIAPYNQSITMI